MKQARAWRLLLDTGLGAWPMEEEGEGEAVDVAPFPPDNGKSAPILYFSHTFHALFHAWWSTTAG